MKGDAIAIKRWEVTYCGKPFLLYADSPDKIKEDWSSYMDEGSDIKPWTNTRHIDLIKEIKDKSEFIGNKLSKNQRDMREWYRAKCFCGEVLIRLSYDISDGEYYTCCQYQVWEYNRFINPITWVMTTIEDFYDKIFVIDKMKYVEYSFRAYGQPKLVRPKELKGIKSIGSAEFIYKHCNPQVFIKDNDVWIKHTDYFSCRWQPPEGERIDMPLSYYAKKYFNIDKNEKFCYPDCWGDIILRNEAWLKIENLVPMCEYREMSYLQIARQVLKEQQFIIKGMSSGVEAEWERFWEKVVRLVRDSIGVKDR